MNFGDGKSPGKKRLNCSLPAIASSLKSVFIKLAFPSIICYIFTRLRAKRLKQRHFHAHNDKKQDTIAESGRRCKDLYCANTKSQSQTSEVAAAGLTSAEVPNGSFNPYVPSGSNLAGGWCENGRMGMISRIVRIGR